MHKYGLSILATALLAACNAQPPSEKAQPGGNATAPNTVEQVPNGDAALSGLYPGSRPAGSPDRFVTGEPIDRVVEWYRDDTARRAEMMFVSSERRDDGYLVIGTAGEEGKSFALLLRPGAGGGTESHVLPYDPNKELKL